MRTSKETIFWIQKVDLESLTNEALENEIKATTVNPNGVYLLLSQRDMRSFDAIKTLAFGALKAEALASGTEIPEYFREEATFFAIVFENCNLVEFVERIKTVCCAVAQAMRDEKAASKQ
jgi:hypothetical protein